MLGLPAAAGRRRGPRPTSSTRSRCALFVLWPGPAAGRRLQARLGSTRAAADRLQRYSHRSLGPRARRLRRRPTSGCGRRGGRTSAAARSRSSHDSGCDPAQLELPAGPTTFKVTNDGADAVSEFEVLDGDRILGENENLAPGLSRSFSLTLKPGGTRRTAPAAETAERGDADGRRRAAAPGAGRAARTAAVDGLPRATSSSQTDAARQARDAVRRTRSRPATSRRRRRCTRRRASRTSGSSRWPRASATSTRQIDAREGDVPAAQWTGFHRIEQALWVDGTTAGHGARSPTSCWRTSTTLQTKVAHDQARAGADRQRRRRAARRGLEVEDHRRGGALLAHRPGRLQGQRRRRAAPRSTPSRPIVAEQRPGARRRDRRALRRTWTRARAVPAGRRLRLLHRRSTQADTRALSAGDRRAGRAALAGRARSSSSAG